jgi:hypothetical protein
MWYRIPSLQRPPLRAVATLAGLLACSGTALAQEAPLEPASAARQASSFPTRPAADDTIRRSAGASIAQSAGSGGETEGETVLLPTNTRGGLGTPHFDDLFGDTQDSRAVTGNCFGEDVRVRNNNRDTAEYSHCMVSDSAGNFYVAWEDDSHSDTYIQTYSSTDGGETWVPYYYVIAGGSDLSSPSIAVGEGTNGDTLLLAYIRDDGVSIPVPEVATKDLSGTTFTVHSVPVWTAWDGYDKPVIVTDSVDYSTWYGYLTCEGIFSSAVNNVNVCTWRSTDGGATWGDELAPYGDTDDLDWTDPDISFGPLEDSLHIVTYQSNNKTIYTSRSDHFGVNWNSAVAVGTLPHLTNNPVDPEIAAAVQNNNVMIAFTLNSGYSGGDDIGYSYSQDDGVTWTIFYSMYGIPEIDESAVALTANEGGGSWHLAYSSGNDHSVRYNRRPQDLSTLWNSSAWIIDDEGAAGSSGDYARKGIASNWTTDGACVAWADARDDHVGDYDTFADRVDAPGLMVDNRLVSYTDAGTVNLALNAGPANAGRIYILVGTMAGTSPGTPLPGGLATIPINYDSFCNLTLTRGAPIFNGFFGILDADGQAMATLNIPAGSGIPPGARMHYAYALAGAWDFASHAVAVDVTLP